MNGMSEPLPEKRPRGRPRLSPEEKQRRKEFQREFQRSKKRTDTENTRFATLPETLRFKENLEKSPVKIRVQLDEIPLRCEIDEIARMKKTILFSPVLDSKELEEGCAKLRELVKNALQIKGEEVNPFEALFYIADTQRAMITVLEGIKHELEEFRLARYGR